MSARKSAAAWLLGTAPELPTDGPALGRLRNIALQGGNGSLCWHEYGADPGDDPDSVATWAKANPGPVQLSDGTAIVSPVIAAMLAVYGAAGEKRRGGAVFV
jgi:hypothetical protein